MAAWSSKMRATYAGSIVLFPNSARRQISSDYLPAPAKS